MSSRAEITTRYARAYVKGSKKDKGLVLDQVVEVTGWSRDNARRRLVAAASKSLGTGRPVAKAPGKPRAPKYSYDALKILQRGLGRFGWPMWEVPRRVDGDPTRWAGTPR